MKRINNIQRNPGIYFIRNKLNDNVYIGSTYNLKRRWNHHIMSLHSGKHHCSHLQNAFNKYGEDSFEFIVVESLETLKNKLELKSILLKKEQEYIDKLKLTSKLYNSNMLAMSSLGTKRSEETKSKLRAVQQNNKERLSKLMNSTKYKEILRNASLGKNNAMFGKTHSNAIKQKLSELMKERHKNGTAPKQVYSQETRRKIGLKSIGRKKKPETIEKFKEIFKYGGNPNAHGVLVYSNITNEFLFECTSMKEASEKTTVCGSHIYKCCNGLRESAKDYCFRYKNTV